MTYDASSPSTGGIRFSQFFRDRLQPLVTIGFQHLHLRAVGRGHFRRIAAALAALVNAGVDPNATASTSGGNVILTARTTAAARVACSASDGNAAGTLVESGLCSLVAFASTEFSMVFSNWTVTVQVPSRP